MSMFIILPVIYIIGFILAPAFMKFIGQKDFFDKADTLMLSPFWPVFMLIGLIYLLFSSLVNVSYFLRDKVPEVSSLIKPKPVFKESSPPVDSLSEELVMLASHIASMQSERDAYLSVASEVGEGAALLLQEKLVVKWKEFKEKLEQLEISAENWQRLG